VEPRKIASHHRARARAALEIGRHALAEREARAALALVPQDLDALLYLARALLGQERLRDALPIAREAVAVAPADGYPRYLLGYTLQLLGEKAEAVAALGDAVAASPYAPRFHARLAIVRLDVGDRAGALESIETALALDPDDDPVLLDEAARVLGQLAQTERAEVLARRALVLRPDCATSHWRLAWVLGLRGRSLEACAAARAAIAIDPNDWVAWDQLGFSAFEAGRLDEAEQALREALRLRPGLSSAVRNLVNLYWRRGQHSRAERLCEEALALHPEDEALRKLREWLRSARRKEAISRGTQWIALGLQLVTLLGEMGRAGTWPTMLVICLLVLVLAAAVWLWRRSARSDEDEDSWSDSS
jgi:superkiller protein 3